MMTPINRIPQMDSNLQFMIAAEMDRTDYHAIPLAEQLEALHSHDEKEDSLSCTLDWAMQIRMEFGLSWSECIDLAMTFFYG